MSNKTLEEIQREHGGQAKLSGSLAKLTVNDLRTLQAAFGTFGATNPSGEALADCCCCCTAVSTASPSL